MVIVLVSDVIILVDRPKHGTVGYFDMIWGSNQAVSAKGNNLISKKKAQEGRTVGELKKLGHSSRCCVKKIMPVKSFKLDFTKLKRFLTNSTWQYCKAEFCFKSVALLPTTAKWTQNFECSRYPKMYPSISKTFPNLKLVLHRTEHKILVHTWKCTLVFQKLS